MIKKRIKVMITAFRDGFQSVYGARVFTKDFMPAVEAARAAGVSHFESGGGARFQSLYFYSNEDAFDMMDAFRQAAGPEANLQTLARGVNVVGLESQPSDIVKLHAELFKKHGVTTIRNFDALNDVNNLVYSGKCIHEAGLKHEAVVALMSLPPGIKGGDRVHTADYYAGVLRGILDAGIPYDSICFKDASGTTTPRVCHETVKKARRLVPAGTKIVFHTHDTAGTGISCYEAAIEAGADSIDLSMAPVSGGTCQPDVLSMWHALRGTEYDLGIEYDKMREAEEVFKECMKDYFLPPESKAVEPLIPMSPMPGGALTANTQMMRDNNLMDKYEAVIKEMREVVERGGFGTSVTPVSQFYFQQAFNNVMFGRWERIADGYGKMVLGYFGKTPVKPDPEVVKIAAEKMELEPTDKNPLELNDADPSKGIEAARKVLVEENLEVTDENIFIVATCKEKGVTYLKGQATIGVRKVEPPVKKEQAVYTVTVDGEGYQVALRGKSAIVNGKSYAVDVQEGGELDVPAQPPAERAGPAPAPAQPVAAGGTVPITTDLPGLVVKIHVRVGDRIQQGDTLLLLESLKIEIPVTAPAAGTVASIAVAAGAQIEAGQTLVEITSG